VRVTHRFHPLSGRDFEFVAHRHNWGEDRVHLHDENGVLFSLPAGWTDVAPADPFAVIADGRCPFTTGGLLALADLIDRRSRERKFAVPLELSQSGYVFMGAHIRIGTSGKISPRLYFHDATARTSKIFIGYIGPHLITRR
jgi:hypothetical protein